jgi:peptidyl-prolyl cis-trans isomerase D
MVRAACRAGCLAVFRMPPMLAVIRRFSKTWPARVLFLVLVGAFGLWGVAGRLNDNNDTAVAHVGKTRIEIAQAQRAYTQQMGRLRRKNGPRFQPSAAVQKQTASEVVRQLVVGQLLNNELTHLGVVVPDAAVRETTFNLGAFKGPDGTFDRATFLRVLASNDMDEAGFIELARGDLGHQQLTGALSAGIAAPQSLVDGVFTYLRQTRIVQAVAVTMGQGAPIASPDPAELHRFWANHPSLYTTPEYRRIKVIVLSAQTLGKQIKVSEADIKAYYDADQLDYDKPERRSVQIVTAPDAAVAGRIASAWKAGLDWGAVQALSKTAGASALELASSKKIELPDQAMAAAAFAAPVDQVSAPLKGDFGWYVVKVTQVTPASLTTLAQAHDQIRDKIAAARATDGMDDKVNKLEDALAGGGGLDNLPADMGIAAVEGTLDAQGMTPQGAPAPLPAYPALRKAIIEAAFKHKPGDDPQLEQVPATKDEPAGAYYAVSVQGITKPNQRPYDSVADQVLKDWTVAQLRHAAEIKAAAVLTAAKGGTSLAQAAVAQGLTAHVLPPIPREAGGAAPPPGVPQSLVAPLFGMKQGEVTMVDTPDGFMVAQLQTIDSPAPSNDPIGVGQLRTELTESMTNDASELFLAALEQRNKVTVNQAVVRQIAQP